MANPNVAATSKSDEDSNRAYVGTAKMGMLPVAFSEHHPSIVFRWNIEHVRAPMPRKIMTHSSRRWETGIWIPAWAWAIFCLRDAMEVFTNAWTTVQENKPKILELKSTYDSAIANPEKKIVLLTEIRMTIDSSALVNVERDGFRMEGIDSRDTLRVACDASLRRAQEELDKLEAIR